MEREEILNQYLNELLSIKSRLKLCSYLLKQGYKVDKEELDHLLESYTKLETKINKLMSKHK